MELWMLPPLAITLLPLLLAPSGTGATAGNALVQGTRKPGDKLLFEFRLARRFKTLQVLTETVVYPMTTGQRSGTITVVDVRSRRRNLDEVRVKSGGVGHKFAKIRFRSARGRGLDYVVKIYGFPDDGGRGVNLESATGGREDGVDDGTTIDAVAEVEVMPVTSAAELDHDSATVPSE